MSYSPFLEPRFPDKAMPQFGIPTSQEVMQQLEDCRATICDPEAQLEQERAIREKNAEMHRELIKRIFKNRVWLQYTMNIQKAGLCSGFFNIHRGASERTWTWRSTRSLKVRRLLE